MSRLINAIELSINGNSHQSSKSCLLNADRVRNVTSVDPSGCELNYFESFGAANPILRVGEDKSTIITRVNTANTSNSIMELELTQKHADGTTSAITVAIQDILKVYFYPGDPTDSLLVVQDTTKTSTINIRVDETKAAILAAANA